MLVSHVAQAHAPDYALLVVAADAPLGQMTRLHLKLALALRLRRGAVRVEMHAYGYDAAPLGGCMRVAYGVKYRVLPTRRRRGRR